MSEENEQNLDWLPIRRLDGRPMVCRKIQSCVDMTIIHPVRDQIPVEGGYMGLVDARLALVEPLPGRELVCFVRALDNGNWGTMDHYVEPRPGNRVAEEFDEAALNQAIGDDWGYVTADFAIYRRVSEE